MRSPIRILLLITGILLITACGPSTAKVRDVQSILCDGPRPYEGPPLYAQRVELPANTFVIGPAFDVATNNRLDAAMTTALQRTQAEVMTAALATTTGHWSATRDADGVPQPQRLWWASVGKALTATVIMQLVEEGKLQLDAPLARWLPDFPNSQAITIDHLLHHTAGIFSANEDPVVAREARYHTPEEGFTVAAKHGALCCPGQWWRYSNTGYAMLGRIIEAVDGRPYHQAVNERIAARLQLATLQALAPGEEPSDVARLKPSNRAEPRMVPNWAYAAGGVVASADDMLRFWHALLTAKLLTAEHTTGLVEQLYPMFDQGTFYGRGVMLYAFSHPTLGARTWIGHSGGSPGIKAVVLFSPADQAFVAVALTGDGSAEACANLLLSSMLPPRP